ncbi:OprO/OprP family phosphate-selective porin [Sphingomonas sp. OK281]|uniref:OprO/OprP family phosphate-selective porin n=1 Tax=Sphingomonas sp. OK281 TaxID=1881067 RepID=UPI0008F42570|nr:porin [Sphingomonas sp. OK281]SFO43091.1 phosphate-selective porin OprO and OprP [Sphingomonas sp. OK281]
MAAIVATSALVAVTPARAQDAALERLVREQAILLQLQQARIDALERSVQAISATNGGRSQARESSSTTTLMPRELAQGGTRRAERADALRQVPAGNAALRPPSDPLTSPSQSGQVAGGDEVFDWKKGLPQVVSQDGRFAFRLRGRALLDLSTTFGSRFDARNITGTEARSVRLGVEGRAGDKLAYLVEADFANNQTALRSAYLALTDKWGKASWELSLGNRLTDRSFDGASSSDSLPLLERSAAALATAPRKGSFGLGATLKAFAPTWHAAVQIAGNDVSTNGSVSDSATFTGRVHWNPWRSQDAIIHLGTWAYRENFSSGVTGVALATQVGGRFNDLVTTQAMSLLNPDHGNAFGFEAGGTWKSLWMFGEYAKRDLYARGEVGAGVTAGSISTGYYLTGEKAPYVARTGTWSKPRVLHPIAEGGSGAVEIAARYDRLDYSGLTGADGWSATLGANWYLMDWVRLSLDGISWHTNNRTGTFIGGDDGNTVYTRVQVSF